MKPPTSNVDPTGPKVGAPGQGPGKVEAGTGAAKITPAGPVAGGASQVEPSKPEAPKPTTAGADLKPGSAKDTGASPNIPPPGVKADAPKVEPAKVEPAKADAGKSDSAKSDPLKSTATKPEPLKPEPAKPEAVKPDASKAEALKPGPGPQPTSRPAGAVEDGPIIDLKAKRLNEPGTPPKDEAAKASGPASDETASPAAPSRARGAGFGSMVAAGLLGGIIGAGLLFAVDQSGVISPRGEDPRLAALDRRISALAPRDALTDLDKRIAANETALKPLPEAVRGAEAIAREALQKSGAAPASATSEGTAPGAPAPSLPPDLLARLESLDQRVSALQEEPGREQPAGGQATTIPAGGDLAGLEQRLKALEGKAETAKPEAQPDLGAKLAALQSDVESRTKANSEADQALGEKIAGLQKSLDARVQAATEAVQSATQASRLAAEASKAQTEDAAKVVERQLQAQADRIAGLDKAVADRAEASTVQAAVRVISADRIAAALEAGTPYADALAALRSMEPGDPARLTALAVFADRGAPTARSLAAEFRPISERIAAARKAAQAKAVAETGDIAKRFASMAESIVQVRRVDAPAAGNASPAPDPEAKVQEALDRGAIAEAAQAFAALPEDVRTQAGEFGTKLKSRAAAAEAAQALLTDTFKGLSAPAASR